MIILLGVSLFVGLLFLFAFIWSVKSGQYEDDYSPAHKMLFDNKPMDDLKVPKIMEKPKEKCN